MGCVHTTIDADVAGQNFGDDVGQASQKYNKRMNKVPNEVVQWSSKGDIASVTLKVLRETALDDDKGYAKSYQANTLGTFELTKSGSTLSLSDLETYQRKKFPKWKGYRKCKYCTHGDEFIQTSIKSSSESVSSSLRETVINVSATMEKSKEESKRVKKGKRKTPTDLPSRDSCRNCSTKLTEVKNNARNNNVNVSGGQERGTSRFINLLAMNALDLTAPASDALLKNRKNAWVQLAGHPGSFAPAGPDTIWKKRLMKDNSEVKAYQALMNDAARGLVPTFYREVEYHGDFFIEMEDLLRHFHDPHIMDIKMGCRTFLEAEVKNPVLRKDLYEKMIRLHSSAPTEEEHEQRAITKLRYMQFREQESSTASLGFRIEAIRVSGQTPVTDLKKVKTSEEVGDIMGTFINRKQNVRMSLLKRLVQIRDCFEKSDFFMTHELIGSSLLIMFDDRGKTGVWMIDFAKTLLVEPGLTHRIAWSLCNHEDGYLTGMDNLIQVFQSLDFSQSDDSEPVADLHGLVEQEAINDTT